MFFYLNWYKYGGGVEFLCLNFAVREIIAMLATVFEYRFLDERLPNFKEYPCNI